MKSILMLSLFFVSPLASAGAGWLSHDVRIEVRAPHVIAKTAGGSCRDRIRQIVCLVEPRTGDWEGNDTRACEATAFDYAAPFEAHYDRSSPLLQKMYCHLDRIYVEKSFEGTAYAGLVTDPQNNTLVAGTIGIREEVLHGATDFYRWLSWKEETSFGGSTDSRSPLGGVVSYGGNGNAGELFFDHVLAHEFGHIFDFTAGLNGYDDCRWEEKPGGSWERIGICVPRPGSWTALSWGAGDPKPLPAFDFALRANLCFYFCQGHFMAPDQAGELFRQLLGSPFVSTYAATNSGDDFAETLAYVILHAEKAVQWTVTAGGQVFDLSQHFRSEALRPKREYIERWLASGVQYPGPGAGTQLIDLSRENKH